jgi:hypothetical protein
MPVQDRLLWVVVRVGKTCMLWSRLDGGVPSYMGGSRMMIYTFVLWGFAWVMVMLGLMLLIEDIFIS